MEHLLYEWGYFFLIIAALIEGELLLLLAGSMAYHGYFSLPIVMLFAFVGAIIHDQLLYWVGYFGGDSLLKKFPSLKLKADKAVKLLRKHSTLLILGFRFVYGIRTATPIVVGLSGVPQKKYAALTFLAAAIWAVIVSGVGYWFAEVIEVVQQQFEHGIKILAASILAIVLVGGVVYYLTRYKRTSKSIIINEKDKR